MSSYQEMKDRMYGKTTSSTSQKKSSGSNSGGGSVGGSYDDMKNRLFSGTTVYLGDSKTERSLTGWVDRYNKTMEGLSAATTGKYYSRDAIDRYSRDIDSLVQQYDSINDYASVYGFQDSLKHYGKLREIQNAIQRQNSWYEKYRGRGHEDIENILSNMDAGDERDWLEANLYDVYKTAPDYQQRSQTGLAAFEASKPKNQEEESWFEAIGRYLSKASDTTMALGDTGRMAQEYRKDTTYREPADNWTDDQRNTYGYLYSINPEAASDFAVKTSENYRRAENQEKLEAVQGWAIKNGFNASAGTVAAIAMMPLSLADTLNALTEYNARGTISTPSSPTPGQVSEAITGAVGQSLNDKHGTISGKIPVIGGKGWGDAYQLGTSIANSLLSAYTQGSIGTDILFFGSAASSTMYNKKQQGATDEQAIKMGVLAGLAEAAGEHFSIENLRKIRDAEMKSFFANVLKQSGIESSEEGFTTLMNNFAEQLIMGKDSEFYKKAQEYMANGMSEKEAKKKAWTDMAEDLAFDMVGGALSGGISTGIQTGAQKIFGGTQQAQTHHEPLATDKSGNATELAKNATAAPNNVTSAPNNVTQASDNVTKPAVGVSKMETVQVKPDMDSFAQQFGTQAEAVKRNYLEGQDLQEYEVGFQTAYAMGLEGGKVEALTKVPYLSQSQREIAFNLGRDAAAAQKAAAPKKAAVTAKMTTEEGTQDVTIAEVVDMDDTTMTFRLEDGRTVTDNDLDFEKGQELMAAAWELGMDVKSVNTIVTESAANTAADADQAAGIQQAYHYGQYGYTMEQLTKHGTDAAALTDGQQKAAWEAGRQIYLQKGSAPAPALKVTKASGVWFDAGGGNVRSFDDADLSGLSEAAVAGARAAQVLQKLGIGKNYYFYESYVNKAGERVYKDENGQERKAPNGWFYRADGSIHIDLNAGAGGNGLTLYTLSHELTHFVENWDKQGYRKLSEFLVANYAKHGNVDAMVADKQAELSAGRGAEVSYEEAYSEFIADSMEAMLSDGNVLEKLQELKKTDRSLFDKIKEFFDNLARKIRSAYKDLKPDSWEGQAVLEMKDQIEQIQQLFAEALAEASEHYAASEEIGLNVDAETESVAPSVQYSERTWKESDYVQQRNKAAQEISDAIGVSVKKAKAYIDSVNSIAKMIAEDRTRLDYFSSPGRSSFISNVEYGGSFDFSTLCKKRRLLTGTFTAIQKALPNTALTANEILDIRNRMKDAGLEVSCGLCYVEGSRANMGQFAKEFLRLYKQYYPDAWQPNMADVNTPDGIEWVRINHPECYEQYEYFWNHYGTLKAGDKNLFASQQKPKLYQLHTEYKGEILQKFKGDDNVEEKNLNGGIRLQSFSDFEIVHLIDTMQIIMDMSRVGLAGQAYTKVPDFAWALGDTGLKINLSLIAKGVDESGNLIFDDIEGMPIAEAMKLRDRYSDNVGTILVAFNDAQLMAAMADDRVDFIIPFHRSQWKKSQYEAMGLPAKTKDYTFMQNEKFIKPQYHEYRGRMVKDKATNYMPNEYWDFSKTGKENAEAYLQMCARNNKRPKFYKLLQNNGDGSYSLKADGSTNGYWKLLIDFKMYDNDGNGSPQMPVRPDFNMVEATRMLDDYKGGHSNFPVAQGIVDSFVNEYKENHGDRMYSDRKKTVDNSSVQEDNVVRGENYEDRRIRKGTETGTAGSGNDRRADPGSTGHAPKAPEWRSLDSGVKRKVRSVIKKHLNSSPNINEALAVIYSYVGRTDETITEYTDRKAMDILAEKLYTAALTDHPVIFESNWSFLGGSISSLQKNIKSAAQSTSGGERMFSDRKFPTNAEKIAKDYFGTTPKWSETGWLLQDGSQLDFSGRHWERDPDNEIALGESYYSGKRNMEHYEIAEAFPNLRDFSSMEYRGEHLDGFIQRGNIRIVGKGTIALETMPTDKQFEKLRSYFRENINRYIVIGIGKGGLNFPEGTNPGIIVEAIRDYFSKNRRNQSDVMRFHTMYQDRSTGTSNRALLAGAFEGLTRNSAEYEFIQQYRENVDKLNEQERKLQEIRSEIRKISFGKGPRDAKRLQELQEEATKTANRIDIYDKRLLKLETAKPLQDVLEREKEKVRKATRQKGQEAMAEYREKRMDSAAKKDAKRKIRRAVMDLDKLLNRGDKKKHVKDGMTSMVGSVLKLADALFMDEYTNRDMIRNGVGVELTDAEEKLFREAQQILQQAESGAVIEGMEFTSEVEAMEQLKKLDQKLSSKMVGLKDVFARERKRLYGTTVSDLLGKLADEYSRLSEAEDGAVRAAKDENVYAHLLQLQKDVGGTTVRDMTLKQMEAVADAFTMVLTTVRNANKMFAKNLQFKRDTLAGMVMGEIGSAAKKLSKLVAPGKDIASVFSWNNLKPVYAFERLGSGTLKTMYQNIRKGQDVWSRDMQEADDFRREQYKKHNRKGWDLQKQHSFEFESGKVDLNLEQIMSLYAYSRREAALDHLLKGGFVFSGNTEVLVKKNGIQRRYLKKDATAYNLSADELMQVIGTLTEEQKAFVVEMQTYLSDTMGGKGNEVSMQMYGIKSFGEKNYFPLRSAGQYMEKAKEDSFRKEQGQISIVNSGFTKATTPHASNPITLDGFMNVWAEHVNDMSMYHGFVLPMEDFRRVYNYSTPNVEEGNSQSVNAAIENAFGKAATGYIDQLYKDLNGGAVSDNRETFSKKLVGLHKKAAVFASASVVIQQPSAIVRAFALIDPRHFIGPKVDRKRHKLLWEEVKLYAPVAFVKEMGYFDTGMGRSARDFLQAEEYTGIREKMAAIFTDADYRDEILGKAPALADEITWCGIWEAVKRETKAKNPAMDVRSDAFLQLAGERFSDVIDKTQVYDSVLSRSANMRSKSGLMNMVTSFMAEPTTSINMLEDALRKGDRKQLKRTVGAVYGSVLLNSLLVSLVYAARDDDEDETWWEKYLSSVAVEMMDGINPITYYPILRDIWSIGQGFDVERADMTLISDFADAAKKMVGAGLKVASASEEERDSAMAAWADSLWGLGDSVASLAGVPMKNIRRDIEACINLHRTIGADLTNRDTSLMSLQDAVLADVINSIPIVGLLYDKSKRDRLYGAIMEGDTVYAQRLKSGYETDSSYHSAIRLALRDNDSRIWEAAAAWNAGDLETYIRIAKEIRGENRFEQDDIVLAIRAEASSMEENTGSGSSKKQGYFTAEKFGTAMSQGNTAMADMIRQDLIDTKMANGNTREEAEESVKSAARSLLKELYAAGTITGMNAEKMLVKYGGYDRDSASGKVTQWQYEVDHPELDGRITFSQYKRWEADGKSRGVSLDLFTEVAEYQDSGTSGSNRSQEEVAGYINRLPISTAQKDALWCCFWKESTLHKAPWH